MSYTIPVHVVSIFDVDDDTPFPGEWAKRADGCVHRLATDNTSDMAGILDYIAWLNTLPARWSDADVYTLSSLPIRTNQ